MYVIMCMVIIKIILIFAMTSMHKVMQENYFLNYDVIILVGKNRKKCYMLQTSNF